MATNRNHKTGKNRMESYAKQLQALELRKAGVPYATIAEKVGYSQASGAYHAVMRAMREAKREPVAEVRKLEMERLDALLLSVWHKALGGDTKAVMASLRIMERRASLMGLDAPIKRADTITINREAIATEVATELGMPVDQVLSLIPVAEKAITPSELAD